MSDNPNKNIDSLTPQEKDDVFESLEEIKSSLDAQDEMLGEILEKLDNLSRPGTDYEEYTS